MKRIVTGHDGQGKAVIVSQEEPQVFEPLPGWKLIEFWRTEGKVKIPDDGGDPVEKITSFTPNEGGTRFRIFTIPPGIDENDPATRQRLKEAILRAAPQVPGLGERMEPDQPGMHTTDTVDYVAVLSGEADLELDDGTSVHLVPGDCVVQRGTRHAWRNRGRVPFVAACVMVGAVR